ncbi:MAG: carbohydrate porin [Alphaproteobacteria bacterium]|nr:carbohydrate porin [Alphaproteobacteria bacterium]
MANKFPICFVLLFLASPAFATDRYEEFKKDLKENIGLDYLLNISTLPQYGIPGARASWQNMYRSDANLDITQGLSAQWGYTWVRYFGTDAKAVSDSMGIVSPINDYPNNLHIFEKLSLTYELRGFSLTLGQFPIDGFDGRAIDSDQQINFINYSLSQNGSQAYPQASIGGYLSFSPNQEWTFTVGAQDATNISGGRVDASNLGDKRITSFGYASYQPSKDGQYSLLLYYQPSVELQPEESFGYSFNVLQNLGRWGLFGRINGTSETYLPIKQSYVLGTVYNNLLGENPLDQLGFAYALNRLNTEITQRAYENILEVYWTFGITKYVIITPDIQFFINPGNDRNRGAAMAATLRFTVML